MYEKGGDDCSQYLNFSIFNIKLIHFNNHLKLIHISWIACYILNSQYFGKWTNATP